MSARPKPSTREREKKPGKTKNTSPLSLRRGDGSEAKRGRYISLIIFAFAFLLYANTLNHGYVLDDDVVYLKNKDVQAGFSGIGSILHHSFIYGFTGHNDQSYRPVVLIIFAIEKQFFGNNPHTGHLINVLLFALSCVLLYRLMKKLMIGWSGFKIPTNVSEAMAVMVALLFAAHPIHTEAVANIKGRDDILNFIFLVLSLLFILKHIDEGKKINFALSVLFFFLSLLCKEMAVTFLAIIPLTIFFFREVSLKKIAIGMISFAGVFVLYMLIRSSVLETVTFAEKMKVVNNALAAATNSSDRIATAIYILGKYILLLFFPHPLSWDYSFNEIPIVAFTDVKVIITLIVFAALGVYALMVLFKKLKSPQPPLQGGESHYSLLTTHIFAFCILFFFITMSVVSNIFIMIGATLGERFLFTPSLAFCMAVAVVLHPSPSLPKGERAARKSPPLWGGFRWGVLFILLALFSYKTFTRNKDWKDNFSLFLSSVEATPNSSRVQSSLGSSYREQAEKEPAGIKRGNLYGQAIEQYRKAVEILPDNTEALYNMGVCYYSIGDHDHALKVYEQALKVSPEYTNAANNAGVIYFERRDYDNAKKYFELALKYQPDNADALGNLGAINHNLGNLKEAIEYYKKSLAINPSNQNVSRNLESAEKAKTPNP